MLGALAETHHDDAGSGGDAPDRPADALNVSPGPYVGNLTPGSVEDDGSEGDDDDRDERDDRAEERRGDRADEADRHDRKDDRHSDDEEDRSEGDDDDRDEGDDEAERDGGEASPDADWYRVNASDGRDGLACTSAFVEVHEGPPDETRVHLREPAIDVQLNATPDSDGVTLAHVGPDPSGTLVGLTALDPPRVIEYGVEIDVTTIDEVGGAGDEDEVPGPCFGGTLADGAAHEWTFHGEAGDLLHTSVGTELPRTDELVLEGPNGTELGSITSGDDIAIGAAELPETGNYTLSLQADSTETLSTSSSTYIVGFTLADPEEEEEPGCSPHCMAK